MDPQMMTYRSDDCSSNLHEYCNRCQCDCHDLELSLEECQSLARILTYEYINYEDEVARKTVTKIFKFVQAHELDRRNSRPTPGT